MSRVLIFILFLGSIIPAFAQDYEKDIESILNEFAEADNYLIECKVYISGDQDYSFDAFVKSSAKYGSHIKSDIVEMMVNKNYAVAIDHEDKTIHVDEGNFKEKGDNSGAGIEDFENTLKDNKEVLFKGKKGALKYYEISYLNSTMITRVTIDTEMNFFKEIEFVYDDNDLELSSYKVVYTKVDLNPKFKKNDFNQENFVRTSPNKRYIPTGDFKKYKII